jgi:hypothetical protein
MSTWARCAIGKGGASARPQTAVAFSLVYSPPLVFKMGSCQPSEGQPLLIQGLFKGPIPVIDVMAKVHGPGLVGPGGPIEYVDGDRLR